MALAGCSSETLQGAIGQSKYGAYDNPEILYQNDEVGVVIFLTKDGKGDFMVCRSSYEKNGLNRYDLITGSDNSIPVDISKKSEFITVDTITESPNNAIYLVWGGIFHYPSAEEVAYEVRNPQGDQLYQNKVEINNKHVFVDILPEKLTDSYSITFDVVDQEGNILFEYN